MRCDCTDALRCTQRLKLQAGVASAPQLARATPDGRGLA